MFRSLLRTVSGLLMLVMATLGRGVLPGAAAQPAGTVRFDQVTRPVAAITDPQDIQFLLDALFIVPQQDEVPERVEVIDITNNGYGPDDILVVYPSQEAFMIDPLAISDEVQQFMNSWALEADFQVDSGPVPAQAFDPENYTLQQAEYAILYDLMRSIERNYNAAPISLRFERTNAGFTMQMWEYQPEAMRYVPPPPAEPDTLIQRDVIHIVRSDSVLYDMLYLYHVIEETEYIPEAAISAGFVPGRPENRPATPAPAQNAGTPARRETSGNDGHDR
ncbi:hypothetical protein GQ464_002825 [Rhodocaloribacter litoris]|uniref:hypothetical protein n=1 Tax=Rhodocaloribacter litoris TaxID=2558931 RepID=UPI001423E0CC|nr:hypothetical protein [Rhodocaloribacter litoris]QXD15899.1 hypothetical protein GQ464_002825 [Rhodocaloribacter litoris]